MYRLSTEGKHFKCSVPVSVQHPVSLEFRAQKSLKDLYDSGANLPFQPSPYPKMSDMSLSADGIDKLLVGLTWLSLWWYLSMLSFSPQDVLDEIWDWTESVSEVFLPTLEPIVLQILHEDFSPFCSWFSEQSLDTGKLPKFGKRQVCSSSLRKGKKLNSYWPISLTSVLYRVLEHIVASSLSKHFSDLKILIEIQHMFREKKSCETHLIVLIDKSMQIGKQTDLILLDFSKAFNKVFHEKLLQFLHHKGIRRDALRWWFVVDTKRG